MQLHSREHHQTDSTTAPVVHSRSPESLHPATKSCSQLPNTMQTAVQFQHAPSATHLSLHSLHTPWSAGSSQETLFYITMCTACQAQFSLFSPLLSSLLLPHLLLPYLLAYPLTAPQPTGFMLRYMLPQQSTLHSSSTTTCSWGGWLAAPPSTAHGISAEEVSRCTRSFP